MRLKELREEKNLTQADLAIKIGTSQRNISRWENESNEPTASFVVMLADYFQCSIDYLLGRSDDFGNITIKQESSTQKYLDELSPDEQKIITQYRDLKLGYKNLAQKQIQTIWDYQQNEMTQIDSHKKKTPKTS